MIKQAIKSVLGEKNIARIQRVRQAIGAARAMWHNTGRAAMSQSDRTATLCLMQVHQMEKAMVVGKTSYIDTVKYSQLIDRLSELIDGGMSPQDFTVRECAAVIHSALGQVVGHDEDKAVFAAFLEQCGIPLDFRGGVERIPRAEIFAHNDFDYHAFVSSRHSVRRFKDKIIPREAINDIVRDALYCPSICNRQPFKVYFSENPDTVKRIIKAGVEPFVAPNVHDALIVTCDRALLTPAEMNDQEFLNGGIFLGALVLSIHAHGLGSCLFQFLQVNARQEKIRQEFGISSSEVISAFVGIGEPEEEVVYACAQRRPVETVAVEL
ncbi:MAG: nitroreductase family protein [Synergistaceae bacterium]|nr:nitroreductase family protein [Synergistaceae bacterium]